MPTRPARLSLCACAAPRARAAALVLPRARHSRQRACWRVAAQVLRTAKSIIYGAIMILFLETAAARRAQQKFEPLGTRKYTRAAKGVMSMRTTLPVSLLPLAATCILSGLGVA